jgi:cellulose synthase/poly-beta-1,6-N-acetylglucosamine synthase-like glycosyltransferase
MSEVPPRLAVIVPVRNERARIADVLDMIDKQDLQPYEVIVADGLSTDGTREWLEAAKVSRPNLRVIDNPRRIVPAALNVALAATSCELVARMDAHAYYGPEYLERLVEVLDAQPEVSGAGGMMATEGTGPWGRAIATVLSRSLGLGGARHRVGGAGGPVEHVFTCMYRRSAIDAVGGWDETFAANEDYECDARLRAAGGTIWLAPEATSTWYVRESLPALGKQMWRYGYYRARTMLLHPDTLRARHLAPPAALLGIAATTVVRPRWGIAMGSAYLAGTAVAAASYAIEDGSSVARTVPVPAVIHGAWGAGLLAGLIRHSLDLRGRARS